MKHFLDGVPSWGPGEVVVLGDVSLQHLKHIYVFDLYRERLLQELAQAGVSRINGKPIDAVIVSFHSTRRVRELPNGDVLVYGQI